MQVFVAGVLLFIIILKKKKLVCAAYFVKCSYKTSYNTQNINRRFHLCV